MKKMNKENNSANSMETRSEYKRKWMQNERFRKWLVKNSGIALGNLTSDDVDLLRKEYLQCPVVNGKVQLATLQRLLVRAIRLVDDYDFSLTDALHRSRDIEHLLGELHRGEVCFSFVPYRTGEELVVCGTLAGSAASHVRRHTSPHANVIQIAFFDVEYGIWRSMNASNYIGMCE